MKSFGTVESVKEAERDDELHRDRTEEQEGEGKGDMDSENDSKKQCTCAPIFAKTDMLSENEMERDLTGARKCRAQG